MVNKFMIFWTQKTFKKRPQAKKPIFLGLESEKSENLVQHFEIFEKYIKDVPKKTCAEWIIHFSKRAHEVPKWSKTNLVEIQKHCKNVVII